MSQMWHRMRGLAAPIPAVEPGGTDPAEWDPGADVLLPDDHFARIHNPVNGRVPPQLPVAPARPQYPQFEPRQYERFFTTTPAALQRQLGFPAQSVRIDNYSSHWVFVRSAGIYVPPFMYGAVLTLDPAVNVAEYLLAAPLGHTDPSTVESVVLSIWYETQYQPSSGTAVPST